MIFPFIVIKTAKAITKIAVITVMVLRVNIARFRVVFLAMSEKRIVPPSRPLTGKELKAPIKRFKSA